MPDNLLQESSGIARSLLASTNVSTSDVKSGVRFMNPKGEVQTGTLSIIGAYKIFSGQGNQTIDVRSKFPNDYQSFTTSNFIIAITEGWTSNFGENNVQVQGRCYPYKGSYNSITGQLSVSGTPTCMYRTGGGTNVNYYQGVTRYEVYLTGSITNLT